MKPFSSNFPIAIVELYFWTIGQSLKQFSFLNRFICCEAYFSFFIIATLFQILKLEDRLNIYNFAKTISESVEKDDSKEPSSKEKMEAGEYFNEETNKVWNEWIDGHWRGTGIVFPKIV